MAESTHSRQWVQIVAVLSCLIAIISAGTVFFHIIEGWSWVDSYFFTVITLSTVGYGDMVPSTTIGKIGTTAIIFVGLGIFAYAIQLVGRFTVASREKALAKKHNTDMSHSKDGLL